jgi:hypothetical protein
MTRGSKKRSSTVVTLLDAPEVEAMIDSRQWWMFVGTDPVYDDIHERFYPDEGFVTVMGPPPKQFTNAFKFENGPHILMTLNFGKKDMLSAERLAVFLNTHPDNPRGSREYAASDLEQRDIVFLWRC